MNYKYQCHFLTLNYGFKNTFSHCDLVSRVNWEIVEQMLFTCTVLRVMDFTSSVCKRPLKIKVVLAWKT